MGNTIDDETILATLRRMNAETEKFVAEQRKLMAEAEKLASEQRRMNVEADKLIVEQRKLNAEADKFNRDRWAMILTPIIAAIAAVGAWVSAYLQHR